MEHLELSIKNYMIDVMNKVNKNISKKFGVTLEEASSVWIGIGDKYIKDIEINEENVSTEEKDTCDDLSDTEEKIYKNKTTTSCCYILKRGANTGKSCGKNVTKKSKTGSYCLLHYKKEESKSTREDEGEKPSPVKDKKENQKSKINYKILKDKYGNYVHSESGLVFRALDKVVYGKITDDGTVLPLTKLDIEECKKYKFHYVKDKTEEFIST